MRDASRLRSPAQSKSEIVLRNTVVAALILFFAVFFILPIFMVFAGSFYRWNPLKNQMIFLGLDNWRKVFSSELFWRSMGNTVFFAAIATVFRVVIGLALASAIYSRLIKHKSLYRVLYYLPTITPLVAVTFVWKFIFDPQIGLLDQLLHSDINWLFDGRYAMIAILILTIWKDFGYPIRICIRSNAHCSASAWAYSQIFNDLLFLCELLCHGLIYFSKASLTMSFDSVLHVIACTCPDMMAL